MARSALGNDNKKQVQKLIPELTAMSLELSAKGLKYPEMQHVETDYSYDS
jgi:hypothetical protein